MDSGIDAASLPGRIHSSQVFDFDVYDHPVVQGDIHLGLRSVFEAAPDVFYTPRNDGHWVVARYDLITRILADDVHFSTRRQDIPRIEGSYCLIPMNIDPPENAPYRTILMKHFAPAAVSEMDAVMRQWAARLIDPVVEAGSCDFEELGSRFPVSIFMELMGLPMERFEYFRSLVAGYFGPLAADEKLTVQAAICAELDELIAARKAERQDDLVSKLIDARIGDRELSPQELQAICFTLFIGGLDSVASALNFTFYHLAMDKALQCALVDDPGRIGTFVEETFRRYAIANTVRTVVKDIVFEGAQFRVGDMILCSLPASGLDERKFANSTQVDLERKGRSHLAFSTGAHTCIGHFLARAEIRAFVAEWLRRISSFDVANGFVPTYRPGLVMQLPHLPLQWGSDLSLPTRNS